MDNLHQPHSEARKDDSAGRPELSQFASLFAGRGWLGQRLKLEYQDSHYWVSCSPGAFVAYKVNRDWGQSPGAPGWPVCMVTPRRVFNESDLSDMSDLSDRSDKLGTALAAPGAQEWLDILAHGQFKLV